MELQENLMTFGKPPYPYNLLLLLLLGFVIGLSAAIAQDEQQSTILLTEAQEKEAREIEELLIAPCCWTSPVSEHYSGAAWEIRDGIRKKLAAGQSRSEILKFYVDQHGKRILSAPEASGFNSLAYYLPVLFLGAGAAVAVFVIQKLRSRRPEEEAKPVRAKIDPRYADLLEKELQE
jgi:cytochrome c-type biogenesis protein CcmH